MKECDICNTNIITQNKYFYKDEYSILSTLFHQDIIHIILSYYCNFNEYIYFTRERKSRTKPIHLDYDSEDEMYGYYWNETLKLCHVCFQSGIYYSLELQNRLPYTRTDIYYLYQFQKLDLNQQTELIKKIKIKHKNYLFPHNYNCSYYRKKYPILIDNNIWKVTTF